MENLFRLFTHASVQFLLNKHKTDVEKEGGKLWVKLFVLKKKIVFFIFVIHLNFRAKNIFDNMLNWLTQFFLKSQIS